MSSLAVAATKLLPLNREGGPAGRRIPVDPDAMLYPVEAAYLAALSPRTLETLRIRGGGPPFCRIGSRAIRYRRSVLLAWCTSRQRENTSA